MGKGGWDTNVTVIEGLAFIVVGEFLGSINGDFDVEMVGDVEVIFEVEFVEVEMFSTCKAPS